MLSPRFDLVVHKTTHCVHKSAVIPLHLALTGRPIRDGTRLVDLQKLTKFLEQFTVKVPRLINENRKMIIKPNEKRIDCSAILLLRFRRGGHQSTNLVKLSTIMSMYSFIASVRGRVLK